MPDRTATKKIADMKKQFTSAGWGVYFIVTPTPEELSKD